jgi:hypothetical protein
MKTAPALPETEVARSPLDEDDQPRARWERIIGWTIVALATWLVFCVLDANHDWGIHLKLAAGFIPTGVHFSAFHFGDIFANTTTNGGDMGAHVWWPWFLEHNWFPKLRLSGWAPDWYAGFPVGEYYFPLPAVAVALIDHIPFVPYNVAFKLVTISGPLMLPAAAYYFAKGIKAPWPAPPAFAIAALGMLMETRTDWQIYGGNIASTLAGEFSFTIALAFALFGLGALAHTLDTGKRRWLPAVLIACAIMSHIVVGVFIGIAATLLWLTRRPRRTYPLAIAIGGTALAITAVWLLPLEANSAYTQSMRYTKDVPRPGWKLWSWIPAPGFLRRFVNNFVSALGRPIDPSTHKHVMNPLWLPWWIWGLAGIAIIAAGWYRRRSTLVLVVVAFVMGALFVAWPQDSAVWNTRFLPFWLFTWGLIAAMGATEIIRLATTLVRWAYSWIRDGDLQDARARAWAEIATSEADTFDADVKKDAAWALAERRFDQNPSGWQPPEHLAPAAIKKRSRKFGAFAMALFVVIAGVFALNRAWNARNGNPSIAITGWAQWNYSGYENKPVWPQYDAIMTGMEQVADTNGDGRALWEPSSGNPDAINSYGTSLALELLPMFTHGKIDSMEGIYFESSATTSYHFITVSECAEHPSNPVRGLVYGTPENDFDLCVKHLQMLGVRYLMLWTPEAEKKADANAELTLVKTIPGAVPGTSLNGWKVYQVANSDLVVGMSSQPFVVTNTTGGDYSKCWNQPNPDPSTPEPKLGGWECTTAPWWTNRAELDTAYAQTGPKDWPRVKASDLATARPQPIDDPPVVTNVKTSVDKISFDVSQVGKPVEIKESYFPNWQVKGAKGPYRLAPNMMVVVPTSNHVELNYGLTSTDWLGRILTVLGIIALVVLGLWHGGAKYAAGAPKDDDSGSTDDENGGHAPNGETNGDGHDGIAEDEPPPQEREPEPALP